MIYPTPKTQAEKKSIRSILLSEGETKKAKKSGYKYGPQLMDNGFRFDSPSIDIKNKKVALIVNYIN